MSQFNAENKGYLNGYPLFFGEDLGLLDTVNRTYPVLEDLYQTQLAQLWNEFEVDLTQDKLDMLKVDKGSVELMTKTISWQFLADSVAGRSISGILLDHVTNPELEGLINLWSFFETIHARTYSHIVKQTFVDPNEMLKQTYGNVEVLTRSEAIVAAFDTLDAAQTVDEKHDGLLLVLAALFALEAIAFMASFAVTFALVDTGKFQGIGKLVQLICRDELLHTRFDHTILGIVMKDPKWQAALYRNTDRIKAILDEVTGNEQRWADYIFSEGRQVIGLNSTLLKQYVAYMASPVYETFGLDCDFDVPKRNPLPYMQKYIDPSKVQTANMELQNSSYLIGTIEDDTDDLEFD
jgi:ribonucleoside-diphosphate reductase beta chain